MKSDPYLKSMMPYALRLAEGAAKEGEIPVAALITDENGTIITEAVNRVERDRDPTAHAEMLAIKQAAGILGKTRLENCDLWVTLEPCPMCAGAIAHARIRRLYYGADDEKSGGVNSGPLIFNHPTCHHKPEVISGLYGKEVTNLLKAFFKNLR